MVCNFFPIVYPAICPRGCLYLRCLSNHRGFRYECDFINHCWRYITGTRSLIYRTGESTSGTSTERDRADGRRPARVSWAFLWLVHLTGSDLFVIIPPNRQYIVIMPNYMKIKEGDTSIRQVPPAGTNKIYYSIKSIYWQNRDRLRTARHVLCLER